MRKPKLGPTVAAHWQRLYEMNPSGEAGKMTDRQKRHRHEQMWLDWEADREDDDDATA
jgi:hypothetical protein